MTTTSPPDTVAPPTVEDVRVGLRRTLGEEAAAELWASVCAQVGVPTDVAHLSDGEFDALLTRLSRHDRLCHVLAMSWRIRRTAARKLSELGR